jgi:hypothetical protein
VDAEGKTSGCAAVGMPNSWQTASLKGLLGIVPIWTQVPPMATFCSATDTALPSLVAWMAES